MDDNPIGSLWKPVSLLNAHAWEVYFINYITAALFYVYYPSNFFSTHKKNVYEQTTVYGVSVFSEMILWTKETFSFYSNALHLESNLIHRVFHVDVRFENWGISLEVYSSIYPPVLARGYSVMWWV